MTRVEHLLFILSEECDEVGQCASKAARFGLDNIQPGQLLTNADRIVLEYADLMAAMEMLVEGGAVSIDPATFDSHVAAKKAKVEKFLRYSAECGTLTEKTA